MNEPTGWLAEGLLTYLAGTEAERLLTLVSHLSRPGSRVAFEFDALGTEAMRAGAQAVPAMQEYAQMWRSGLPDAPGWMAQHGWCREVQRHAEVATRYGRRMEEPSSGGFLTATRH